MIFLMANGNKTNVSEIGWYANYYKGGRLGIHDMIFVRLENWDIRIAVCVCVCVCVCDA